jgi:hypothetical protein
MNVNKCVSCPVGGAHDFFGPDTVHPLGVNTHEVLTAAGHDGGLVAAGAEILQDFENRLINQLGVKPVVAPMLAAISSLICLSG